MKRTKTSIIIGTYNRHDFLLLTIKSIRKEVKNLNHEIIVIDGGSTDGTIKWLFEQKDIITIIQHNHGKWNGKSITRKSWGYFMNLGFKIASGKYVCMLSDDCLVVPNAIKNGIILFDQELKKNNNIGAVAFYFRDWPMHDIYHVETPFKKMFVNHGLYLNKALKKVNYIDEENFFFYGADVDLCFKMWHQGYKVIDSPTSFIEHYPLANVKIRNSNTNQDELNLIPLINKWHSIFSDMSTETANNIIKLAFNDQYQTAHLFMPLHKNNPSLSQKTSFFKKTQQILAFLRKKQKTSSLRR